MPPLQQEGADLIDHTRALRNQAFAHPMQHLQIGLLDGLGRPELMVGRCTASATASASRKSFFCPLEYGRTYLAGISRGSWPSAWSLRLR